MDRKPTLTLITLALLAMLLALPVAAQDGGDGGDEEDAACEGIVVARAWSRPALQLDGAGNGAAFMVLINPGTADDTLISASSTIAGAIELHDMVMQDGVMVMRPVEDGITVPAGGFTLLQPGSFHVMFINLTRDIDTATDLNVTLEFANAGRVDVAPIITMEPPLPEDAPPLAVAGDIGGCAPVGFYGPWSTGRSNMIGGTATEVSPREMGPNKTAAQMGIPYLGVFGVLLNLGDTDVTLTGVTTPLTENTALVEVEDDWFLIEDYNPRPLESLTVPAGGVAVLQPEGQMIALYEVGEDLASGDTFDLALGFDARDPVLATVTVRAAEAPGTMPMDEMEHNVEPDAESDAMNEEDSTGDDTED